MSVARTVTLAVAVAAGAGFVTACGDDTQAISKDDFIEQANAICQATNDELEPMFDAVFEGLDEFDPDDPQTENVLFVRWADAMDTAEQVVLDQNDKIRALGAPGGDKDLIEQLLDDVDTAVIGFAETSRAAADGDQTAMAALDSESDDPFAEVDRRARDYGLTVCGEEG